MTQTVLLAGATGLLGSQIARCLLDQPDARLRLLARGAETVEGNLSDRATQGVDVIVSAVQGGPDVTVDGQVALAEAGRRNGVRRVPPSDLAFGLFKATPGEVIEARTGRRFERRPLGSETDLRAAMAEEGKDAATPFKAVMLAYQLYMLTGQTALSDLQNGRCPGLELESFRSTGCACWSSSGRACRSTAPPRTISPPTRPP